MAGARRELLLRVHRHRLRREDLEDCYSQATLELLLRARAGATYASRRHLANTLEQRFLSRALDRRRAISGRSPMQAALETAVSVGAAEEPSLHIVDARAHPEQVVLGREELRELGSIAQQLTLDQRLVLLCEAGLLPIDAPELCRRMGWSAEKYRKLAQRARARVRVLRRPGLTHVTNPSPRSEQLPGTPMTTSPPTHRTVPWDAGGRLNGRPHGEAQPRARGRGSEGFPSPAPAARAQGAEHRT